MRHGNDLLTPDLFPLPTARLAAAGTLAVGVDLRHLISEEIARSQRSRQEIAEAMSELTGQPISKHSLDSWTAESRDAWRFPLEYLPAFEEATQTHGLTTWMADVRGGKMLFGREALDAEIGRLERERDDSTRRIRQLKQLAGGMQ